MKKKEGKFKRIYLISNNVLGSGCADDTYLLILVNPNRMNETVITYNRWLVDCVLVVTTTFGKHSACCFICARHTVGPLLIVLYRCTLSNGNI